MRGLAAILFVIIGISFGVFVLDNHINAKTGNEIKNFEFSTFTSAVCESKDDLVYCRDELFVNCSGRVSKANGSAECNGIKLDSPKVTGFAVFEEVH